MEAKHAAETDPTYPSPKTLIDKLTLSPLPDEALPPADGLFHATSFHYSNLKCSKVQTTFHNQMATLC